MKFEDLAIGAIICVLFLAAMIAPILLIQNAPKRAYKIERIQGWERLDANTRPR